MPRAQRVTIFSKGVDLISPLNGEEGLWGDRAVQGGGLGVGAWAPRIP